MTSTKHPFKGYSVARTFSNSDNANKYAKTIRPKFDSVKVHEGTKGAAYGNKRKVYRVMVK